MYGHTSVYMQLIRFVNFSICDKNPQRLKNSVEGNFDPIRNHNDNTTHDKNCGCFAVGNIIKFFLNALQKVWQRKFANNSLGWNF